MKHRADALEMKFNECFDIKNDFFFQYECLQTEEEAARKWNILSYVSCFICFVALAITATMRDEEINMEKFTLQFDLLTVTAGDFTVEMSVSDDQYEKFVEEHTDLIERHDGSIA
jgi:hypothetical protein